MKEESDLYVTFRPSKKTSTEPAEVLEMPVREFRKRVKERLGSLELSQSELARRLGVYSSRINEALHGKPTGRKYIQQIVDFLEL